MKPTFARKLILALALLLLAYGAAVALLGRHLAREYEHESLQRLSHGLARHIVEHWPEVAKDSAGTDDQATRGALMNMLMVVNPGIEVYLLDADGRVSAYIGAPDMVRRAAVDLAPVRAFLRGAPLPLRGTDPKSGRDDKTFSAAMFPPRAGDSRPPGYLYVVLEGQARAQVAGPLGLQSAWQTASAVAALALALTVALGALVFHRLTQPLRRLALRMRGFTVAPAAPASAAHETAGQSVAASGDEVTAIAQAFDALAERVSREVQAQSDQAAAHREVMANVAHDLRTPLTALHGHLEALRLVGHNGDAQRQRRLVDTALAQSDKVRRLSQQLFELATLQATEHLPQRERFRLDELVADTVQKFELTAPVSLAGPAPGRIELDGDLHLIERALTNLIDNAVRHGAGAEAVRVRVLFDDAQVSVLVEDRGPGLPAELARRLDAGHPVRDPPLARPGGGIGGLGLAIVQRIAALHGGALRTLPAPAGGARLSLSLPLAAQAERRP